MTKCQVCGLPTQENTADYYVEDLTGIHVGLVNAAKIATCQSCGEETVTIPDVEGLIAAAAVCRVMIPIKLNGAEIKFLRKVMEYSAKELSEILDVRPETFSRWENDKDQMPVLAEKVFRGLVGGFIKEGEVDKAPAVDYDRQAINLMNITQLRLVSDQPLMNFERIKVKVEKKKQEAWDGTERIAIAA